jgi:Family of unknown function (DUF6277)
MFDPSEILAAAQSAHDAGTAARNQTTAAFMAGTPAMPVASASNASNVIDNVHQNGQQMLANLIQAKSSIDSQVAAHQQKQRSELPGNFKADMSDLRPTNARGFPRELPEEYFAPFKF